MLYQQGLIKDCTGKYLIDFSLNVNEIIGRMKLYFVWACPASSNLKDK